MKILVVNHIAGRIERLEAALARGSAAHLGAVVVLGDLVAAQQGQPATGDYDSLLDRLAASGVPVFLVSGAPDTSVEALRSAVAAARRPRQLHLLHRSAAVLGVSDVVAGFGGLAASVAYLVGWWMQHITD